jgi:hypothetical protein
MQPSHPPTVAVPLLQRPCTGHCAIPGLLDAQGCEVCASSPVNPVRPPRFPKGTGATLITQLGSLMLHEKIAGCASLLLYHASSQPPLFPG